MKASRHYSSRIPTATNISLTETVDGATVLSVSHSAVTNTATYDAYRREMVRTDGRGNAMINAYDTLGRLASVTDPLGATTSYAYDAVGNLVAVTNALGNVVVYEYDLRGNKTYEGGATYPVRYTYDDFDNKTTMTTYRNESLQSGDTTTWLYDEPTGLLTNKVYADGKGPTYTYTIDGKLATRTWARGIATGYSYDNWNNLTNTVYSDGTPTISLFYDVLGRQIKANDAAGVTTFLYDAFGSLTNETVIGVAGTNTIIRHWDNYGRTTGYSLVGRVVPNEPQRQSTLAYDPVTGRLLTMLANGSDTPFTWNYLDGSDLKSSLSYPNGLTASWQYDANNQLLQVCNATPTNTISQYDYSYDPAGRRVACGKSGSAFAQNDTLSYGYNEKSELTNAVAAVDAAYRYSYDFDEIGNRESSSERGTNSVYTANNLNQYTAVDDFAPQFDDDGNQTLVKTATGIWSVTYNGENRPVQWQCVSTNSLTPNSFTPSLISMSYDRMGRRVVKNDLRFVYDGYLQIANFELKTPNSKLQTFVWDPTEPVATRPLLWNRYSSFSYYTYDGNKNVSETVDFNGEVAAHYEYAPFGEVRIMHGERASVNPWRFSSEYADDDSATIYYNYRHYEPIMGRWLCRDPIEDSAAMVVAYVYANNSPAVEFDLLGGISLGDFVERFVNASLGVDFSIPLLGPTGWPMPMIPGAPRAQIHVVVSGEKRRCCGKSGRGIYYKGSIGVEAYLVWGHGERRPFKGRDRNNRDPEWPGEKIKRHDYHPPDSGYRSRDLHFDGNLGTLPACPQKGLHWGGFTGAIFLRGSIGCGFAGLQANVQINIAADMDLASLFSASWGLARNVKGATVEFGGGGSGNWTYR